MQTEDATKGKNRPEPIERPSTKAATARVTAEETKRIWAERKERRAKALRQLESN